MILIDSGRIAVFDCFSGISGDMTIGAFLDAGMDFEYLKTELSKLALKDYELTLEKVKRKALVGTLFSVIEKHSHPKHEHHNHEHHHGADFKSIKELIVSSELKESVKKRSLKIFSVLAEAEAKVHGVEVDLVHFHEVGALDSIIDIVGISICLDYFNIDKVYVRSIFVGTGVLEGSSHGTFPLPAPATAVLLQGFSVQMSGIEAELVTPTGAAFLAAFAEKKTSTPDLCIERVGFGAGSRDNDERANLLRMILSEKKGETAQVKQCRVLETNIDDMPATLFDDVFERLFACGAKDVFCSPILMKKNRPAQKLSVIFDIEDEERIKNEVFNSTSTIGVRIYSVDRTILKRMSKSVKTGFGEIDIKFSQCPDGSVRFQPEYKVCKTYAEKANVPVMKIYEAANKAASLLIKEQSVFK